MGSKGSYLALCCEVEHHGSVILWSTSSVCITSDQKAEKESTKQPVTIYPKDPPNDPTLPGKRFISVILELPQIVTPDKDQVFKYELVI